MNPIVPYSFGLSDLPWYLTLIALVVALSVGYTAIGSYKGKVPNRQARGTLLSTAFAAYLFICLICSAWLILLGIEAIGTWSIPNAAKADNPRPGRRGYGIAVLAIKYLPYASVAIGLIVSNLIIFWFARVPRLKYLPFIWLFFAIGIIYLVIHNASVPRVQVALLPPEKSYVHKYGIVDVPFVDANSPFDKAKGYLLGWSYNIDDRPHTFALAFSLPLGSDTSLYNSEYATLPLVIRDDTGTEFMARCWPIISDDSVSLKFDLSPQILNSISMDSEIRLSIDDTDLIASDDLAHALRFIAYDYKNKSASCFAPHSMNDTTWGYTGLCKQLGNATIDWTHGDYPSHITDIVVKRNPEDVQPHSIVLYLASGKLADSISADARDELAILITSATTNRVFADAMDLEHLDADVINGVTQVWVLDKDSTQSIRPCTLSTSPFNDDLLTYSNFARQSLGLATSRSLDQMANANQSIGVLDMDITPFLPTEDKEAFVYKPIVRFGDVEGVLSDDLVLLILEAASLTAN